ncbi:glucosaminidase domain-containing protein [Veillonella criceti]|uniref:Mannosyl-glycoprotein endo-beta-N-acetylglucosaminidase n=1 Tax=Veillonella criceti TaxID=103891 RepID=A0A380NI07_9FIRM|nr:glucosaminidase domain-containing protein [Veillonella criceti]SUP41208.1 Uncharacterised protein [Veillonella criceti]
MEVNQYFFDLAKIAANKASEHGITVDPQWIYTQWYIETSGFTSDVQASHYNLGGIMSSEGGWMKFDNFVDFANYFGKYLTYYSEDGMSNASTLHNYLAALHHGGYFTSDLDTYYHTMLHVLNSINF